MTSPGSTPETRSSTSSLWLGMGIFTAWFSSLIGLLQVDGIRWPLPLLLLAIGLRTFLQTGLFILGHDAMHRSLAPGRPRLNDSLGSLALVLYAGLPYGRCRRHHLHHHRQPGSRRDPDFRPAGDAGALRWYAGFMARYLSLGQLGVLLGVWITTAAFLAREVPLRSLNVVLFWIVPLVLSSLQLFLFGTYLPHRGEGNDVEEGHRVKSLRYPPLVSLLACYHFGYHGEHHAFPTVPWFRLPDLGRAQCL